MSSSPPSDWQSLKAQANALFKAKQLEQAQRLYEQAIDALSQLPADAPIVSTQTAAAAAAPSSATTVSPRSRELCLLYNNLSLTHFQLRHPSASLAAADTALTHDASFLKARLRRALALEQLAAAPSTDASVGIDHVADEQRRAMQLQEAVTIVQKLALILKSQNEATAAALSAAQPAPAVPAGQPSLAEVSTTLVRLRTALSTLHSRAASPMPMLEALRAAVAPASSESSTASSASAPRTTLRNLMRLLTSSGAAKAEALREGLLDTLLQILQAEQSASITMRTRAAAARALRHLLATDMAAAAAGSASAQVGGAASAASASSGSGLDIESVRASIPSLLRLFESLRVSQVSQGTQVPPALPSAVAGLDELLRALVTLLSRVAAHPLLAASSGGGGGGDASLPVTVCSALARCLPRYSTHSPPSLAALLSGSSPLARAQVRLMLSAVDAVTFVASSPFTPLACMKPLRAEWLPLLLVEPLAQLAHGGGHSQQQGGVAAGGGGGPVQGVRSSTLAAVSVLTRHAFPKGNAAAMASANQAHEVLRNMAPQLAQAYGNQTEGEQDTKQQKALEAEGLAIREQMLHLLYAPIIGVIEPEAVSQDGPQAHGQQGQQGVRLHFVRAARLLRGLSLLLQANSLLGNFIVAFGAQKEMVAGGGGAAKEQEAEEQKQKEAAERDEERKSSSSVTAPPAPVSESAPTVLHLLLSFSSFVSQPSPSSSSSSATAVGAPPKVLQLLSAEVLALASSDALIRQTLVRLTRQPAAAGTEGEDDEEEDEELIREGVLDPSARGRGRGRGADVFMDLIVQYTNLDELDKAADSNNKAGGASTTTQPPPPPPPQPRDPDAQAHIPSETIVAHACLALSKLVAVGEWGSVQPPNVTATAAGGASDDSAAAPAAEEAEEVPDAEGTDEFSILLHILMRLIDKYKHFIPRVEKESEREARRIAKTQAKAQARAQKQKQKQRASANADEDDDDDDDDVEDDDDPDSAFDQAHGVALLHLLFESLSYCTLHVYAKKWIMVDSNGENIRGIIAIAAGTNNSSSSSSSGSSSTGSSSATPLGVISDGTIRYALLHLFRNLCTSRASLAATHDAEVEALKKMASKGLAGAAGGGGGNGGATTGASLNEEQNARQQQLAGSPVVIALIVKSLAAHKVVGGLVQLFRAYVVQQQELESNASRAPGAQAAAKAAGVLPLAAVPSSSSTSSLLSPLLANAFAFIFLQLSSQVENRGLVVQQGGVRLLLDLYAASAKPGDDVSAASSNPLAGGGGGGGGSGGSGDENQSLNAPNSPYRCSQDCVSSLARLFVSTNPALVGESNLPGVALVLLEGLEVSEHELQTFECLMGLTNLASFSEDMADFVCNGAATRQTNKAKKAATKPAASSTATAVDAAPANPLNGWFLSKSQLTSSNTLVQRAAVELMTNLVNCAWVRRRVRMLQVEERVARGEKDVTQRDFDREMEEQMANPGAKQSEDLRLLLAFAQSDDLATARAATGALAMLSSDPLIAARIAATTVVSYAPLDEAKGAAADESELDSVAAAEVLASSTHAVPAGSRAVVRTGASIVRRMLRDRDTHKDIRLRVQALQSNFDQLPAAAKRK